MKALSRFKKCDDDVLWGLTHKMGHGPACARASAVRALPEITDQSNSKFYSKTIDLALEMLHDPEPLVRDAVVSVCTALFKQGVCVCVCVCVWLCVCVYVRAFGS